MTDVLSRLLSQRDWLMADGATGTNLFNMGLESGEPPEFWNTDRPDNIRKLYAARSRRGRTSSSPTPSAATRRG
jgi:5-methyltetrahydrofolate--homocysteine methyltransferase